MRGSCIAGFWTQGFSTFYIWVNRSLHGLGKWWTEFRTDEFWFRSVIAFTICLSQFRLRKNGCESLKLIFKKGLKTWNPNFRLDFPTRKIAECLFRRSVCFRNFPLKRRKQPETELMVSLPKHQSVLLVCFNGSCHAVASRFIHDVIQVNRLLFGIRVAFFSVLRARKGTKFEKYYNNWTNAWSKIFNCFKEISFFKPKDIVWDDLIRKYPAMQKFIQ